MEFKDQSNLQYYGSGIFQDFIIAIAVFFIYFTIGIEYYDYVGGGNPEEGIVDFNLFTLLFILSSLVFGSIIFYLLFTKLKGLGIRVVYSIVLSLPYLLLLIEIFSLLLDNGMILPRRILIYFLSLFIPVFGLIFLYVYGKGIRRITIRNLGIIISSVIVGRVLAIYFDITGIIVFAIVLSVFDVYSVFKGPLAKVMGEPQKVENNGNSRPQVPSRGMMDYRFNQICKQGTPVLLSYQNTLLGVGDVLFFSLLMYKSLLEWGLIGFGVTTLMIMIGSSGTLYLLRKISPLPGLPFPVFTSLLGYAGLFLFY